MKNFLRYSFSILIMISCLIVLGIMAFKVLVVDERPPETPPKASSEAPPESPLKEPQDSHVVESAPRPEDAHFTAADENYLKDALFIGDSRTMGLWEYGKIQGANFFADTGMSVYNISEKKVNVPELGKVTLDELLNARQYGKIYLMLGINELGYNRENTVKKYGELLGWLKEKAPNAIIYIEANLHVASSRSESDDIFNNDNINAFNQRISGFIDNKKVFYIDVNELFDDENGNLGEQYTSDSSHVLGKYYATWVDWILTKAIMPDDNNDTQ